MFTKNNDIDLNDLQMIDPALWILITRTMLYCAEYKLPCRITSLVSDRENVKAVSKTHEQGRAIDISTHGWTEQHCNRFKFIMNRDYKDLGAISYSDLKARAVVYGDSKHLDHFHLQVRPNANYKRFIKD